MGLGFSGPEGFKVELGVGVGLVSGVGMECGARLAMLRNELKDETATSGDRGERRCAVGEPDDS